VSESQQAMCLRHVFSVGHDTSRIDSLGNFDRVGQCARRPEPCGYLIWPHTGSTMEQRTREKFMGVAKTQQRTKMACIQGRKHIGHLQSETQTLPAIPFRGVCDECKAKFAPLSQNN
jgi:hypothetical protein